MEAESTSRQDSLYKRLGWFKTSWIIWSAIPFIIRPIAFPICIGFYSRYIKQSDDLEDLRMFHSNVFLNSQLFRMFRPRYHKVRDRIQKELLKPTKNVAVA